MSYQIAINDPTLGPHFKTLNLAWLEKYFVVEPIDEQVLSQPQKIIQQGGFIFYILDNNRVLGCCALKHHGDQVYELTKMAVTKTSQGKGLGKRLMDACISHFESIPGKSLYLETNSSLKTAIKLYEKYHFVAKECPFNTPYDRADYYMEWQG
ncbi:GNAT family N-acetyltransferase [Marinicella rhabdoformis]|uniref:GNAT family N-acetyltransferase n=1 Tax=Marinicella rhabdoformis TaxID=2580566 RepID=UPI0012AEDAD9|nr:GNAT family N-acetyltransferase [Marinicella rhabdoformis]